MARDGAMRSVSPTLAGGAEGRRDVAVRHGFIDIRAKSISLAPEAHCTGGVRRLRSPKRTYRLGVIETVGQHQALIEILLGLFGGRGDRRIVIADIAE